MFVPARDPEGFAIPGELGRSRHRNRDTARDLCGCRIDAANGNGSAQEHPESAVLPDQAGRIAGNDAVRGMKATLTEDLSIHRVDLGDLESRPAAAPQMMA